MYVMAAHEHLSEYQFRYRPTGPQREGIEDRPYYQDWVDPDETLYDHEIQVVHKPTKQRVGGMQWNDNDGRLYSVWVHDDHQRKGIATEMVKHGTKLSDASGMKIHYPTRSDIETEEGAEWAEKMQERGYF